MPSLSFRISYLLSSFLIMESLASRPVNHVHLGLTSDPSIMNVQWTSVQGDCLGDCSSVVEYGTQPYPFDTIVYGYNWTWTDTSVPRTYTFNMGKMTNLTGGQQYYYRVGNPLDGWSGVYSFYATRTGDQINTDQPLKIAWFGDLGWTNAQSLSYLQDEAADHSLDYFVHVGDFAYDLNYRNGTIGDEFESSIESITTTAAYMGCPGNHEYAVGFGHYTNRFQMFVGNESNSGLIPNITDALAGGLPNNHWYSWETVWNGAGVHVIAMSTEVYWIDTVTPLQYAWLEHDLANVNRTRTPWVIVFGHRSMYCSCDSDCDGDATVVRDGQLINGTYYYGMEDLLNKYHVDIWLNGHEHNYERTYSLYNFTLITPPSSGKPGGNASNPEVIVNAQAPIYIISGSAGDVERHEPFTRAQPPYSAYRSNTYGYGRMTIYNATTLLWENIQTDNEYPQTTGTVIDAMLLVKIS